MPAASCAKGGPGKHLAPRLLLRVSAHHRRLCTSEMPSIDTAAPRRRPHVLLASSPRVHRATGCRYPGGSAWQLNTTRAELRRLPKLARVFDFIKTEDAAGSITRQEAVSMVPPLFLDVQTGHRVLDMCAAPGSKTFQLLEALHAAPGDPQVRRTKPSGGFAASSSADPRERQDWILKCLQAEQDHPLAACWAATLCCSPPELWKP
jgi:hypothetical protein